LTKTVKYLSSNSEVMRMTEKLEREPYGDAYYQRPFAIFRLTPSRPLWLNWEDCVAGRPTRFWTREDAEQVMEEGGYSDEEFEVRRLPTVVKETL
jgi:hypothetical protein